MIDLDHKYPIILFPIRIETKYHQSSDDGTRSLRIRFYPDQITINNFDPRLTRNEVEDARDYWKTVGKLNRANIDQFNQDRNSAWTKLVNQYGMPRSAFITKAVISYDPNSEPDPVTPSLKADDMIEKRLEDDYSPPSCKLLPNRFIVHGKFKDSALGVLEPAPIGKDIPEPLLLDFLQGGVNTNKLPNWITDFNEAVTKGMAIEIKLNEQEYKSGFEYIIVYGIRENLSPEQTEQELENLFAAHRYGQGLSFVKQGTPTNLSKLKSKDGQSFFSPHFHAQSDITSYRSMEFSALPNGHTGLLTEQQPDGRIFEIALGINNVANGLLDADNHDQMTATYMSFALWPSVLKYFMNTFLNIPSLHLGGLQNHFVRYVSGQGIVPPIRVGKTPYGILPVTILSEWEDEHIIGDTHFVRTFFAILRLKLLDLKSGFIDQVPTVMKSKTSGIPPADNLLNILSMEAISHSYYVRGFRSLDYVADFSFDILKKMANGMPITQFTYDYLRNRTRQSLEIHLGSIFRDEDLPTPLKEALKNFYNLCPGAGISNIEYPMVNIPEEADSLFPNYIETIYNDVMGQDKNFFKTTKKQIEIPNVAPSDSDPLLFRLLRYSSSIIGQSNDQKEIETFAESLKFLLDRDIKPDRLRALMLQTLDLVSYRLDAWISSFANQRLDHLRQKQDKGLYAGAFGWVENLMPKELDVEGLTKNSVRAGGFIHAPSYAHAAAPAVLRNGYLIHSDEFEKKDLLKINLNSERTKNALDIIIGIENTPLSELLGYMLERRLHDAKIDYIIDEFRKYFPLHKDDRKELKDASESGQERIVTKKSNRWIFCI